MIFRGRKLAVTLANSRTTCGICKAALLTWRTLKGHWTKHALRGERERERKPLHESHRAVLCFASLQYGSTENKTQKVDDYLHWSHCCCLLMTFSAEQNGVKYGKAKIFFAVIHYIRTDKKQ